MKPVAPIDLKSISAPTMTSSKNKENNKKNEDKSPGGTSNAGNKSPADSLFSDGELLSPVNQDVKPNINHPVDDSSGAFDTFEQLARLMNSLSEQGRTNIMAKYAEHAGFTLNKSTTATTTRPLSYPEAYKTVSHQDQDMSPGTMFDGRETPMTTGFTPNVENFSQRQEFPRVPSYGGTTASFTLPPGGSQPVTAGINSSGFTYFVPAVGTSYTVVSPQPSPAYEEPAANKRTTMPPQFANPRTAEPSQFAQTFYVNPTGTTTPMPPQPTNHQYVIPVRQPAAIPSNTMPQQHPAPPPQPTGIPSNTVPHQHPAPPPWAPHASVPGPTFSTGLALRQSPRPDHYVSYENNRVIVPRDKRGVSDKDKMKMHEICTEGITPRITRGNIAKLLSSADDAHDIASDAAQWQSALGNIWSHVVKFDYAHIVYIPMSFDPTNPASLGPNSTFVNSVLNHDQLTDDHYFSWQTLLRRFGRDEELQSDSWFEEKLWKSIDTTLYAEVMSDFNELQSFQKGSISLLRLIINRIVQNNHESQRAMEEYIKTFDIQNFPGEDVTKASLRIKAVAQSLGTTRLPTDIVHRVLDSFARSSTPTFFRSLLSSASNDLQFYGQGEPPPRNSLQDIDFDDG